MKLDDGFIITTRTIRFSSVDVSGWSRKQVDIIRGLLMSVSDEDSMVDLGAVQLLCNAGEGDKGLHAVLDLMIEHQLTGIYV
jgi:hypothetical protein